MDTWQPPPKTSRRHWTPAEAGLTEERPVVVTRYVHECGTVRHDNDFWEIVLVVSGRAEHETDTGVAPLAPGSAVLITPRRFHAYAQCRSLDIRNCAILPSAFERQLAFAVEEGPICRLLHPVWRRPRPSKPRVVVLSEESLTRCLDVIRPVVTRRQTPYHHRPLEMLGRMLVVLYVLAEAWESQHPRTDPPPPVVRRAVSLLEAAPERPWQMEALAAEVNTAPAYLSRLFTGSLGVSPMAYLGRVRMERAAALLRRTDDLVAGIAHAVGYGSPEHFSRLFRRAFGVNPGVYRVRHRGNQALPDTAG
jgi:AraC family L-rhamnose operon transcriptional activator RhaR